ncbi:MAG: hypothetical protein KIS96_15620 [Bauldia sp.]|nr:hypothetical protein [Bauldia sp.]
MAETEPPRAEPSPPPPRDPPPRPRAAAPVGPGSGTSRAGSIAYAILGAVAVVLIGYVLLAAGLIPQRGDADADAALAAASEASAAVETLRGEIAAVPALDLAPLAARLDALETVALPALAADIAALSDQLSTALAGLDTVGRELPLLRRDVDAAAAAAGDPQAAGRLGDQLGALDERVASLESASDSIDPLLGARIARIERELARLGDTIAALTAVADLQGRTEAAAVALAFGNLAAAAGAGNPFRPELAMLTELGVAADATASVAAYAAGVPSVEALAAAFPAVADAVIDATTEESDGFWDRLFGAARGLVEVRPAGPVAGDDPPAILSRMTAAVRAGDLAAALAERAALPEAGLAVSAGWAADAADRIALEAALDALEAALSGSAGP